MSLKEEATRVAVLKALRDLVEAEYQAARHRVLDGLRSARAELALKSIRVTLPDESPVATITLVDPGPAVVVADEDAFTAWVARTYPTEVETLTRVRPGWQRRFVAGLDASVPPVAGVAGPATTPVADPRTGEAVPGLVRLAGQPQSFSLRPVPGGAERIALAWRTGTLDPRRLLALDSGG